MRKRSEHATQWEKMRNAIWVSPDPNGPTVTELESAGFSQPTIYRTADRLERIHEIERVKVDGVVHFKPTVKPHLVTNQAQDSLLTILRSKSTDSSVKLAWRELDDYSMEGMITSDPLLKFLLQPEQVKTERVLRILTRQAVRAGKEFDKLTLDRMKTRQNQAEAIVMNRKVEMDTRDAAFQFLRVLNPNRAFDLALDLISQKGRDGALDSDSPSQLLIDVSSIIIDAPPTVSNRLYELADGKRLAAKRAKRLLQARNQPFRTLMTTPSKSP